MSDKIHLEKIPSSEFKGTKSEVYVPCTTYATATSLYSFSEPLLQDPNYVAKASAEKKPCLRSRYKLDSITLQKGAAFFSSHPCDEQKPSLYDSSSMSLRVGWNSFAMLEKKSDGDGYVMDSLCTIDPRGYHKERLNITTSPIVKTLTTEAIHSCTLVVLLSEDKQKVIFGHFDIREFECFCNAIGNLPTFPINGTLIVSHVEEASFSNTKQTCSLSSFFGSKDLRARLTDGLIKKLSPRRLIRMIRPNHDTLSNKAQRIRTYLPLATLDLSQFSFSATVNQFITQDNQTTYSGAGTFIIKDITMPDPSFSKCFIPQATSATSAQS